jgi:hypothetical protein
MVLQRSGEQGGTSTIDYYRCSKGYSYNYPCSHTRVHRARDVEARVWDLVVSLLRDPERLRAALDALIQEERRAHHGDPEKEARVWLKKIAEIDGKRARFQDMAAEGLISFEELRAKLDALDEVRETARRELDALGERRERLAELERDSDALLETYSEKASRGFEHFTPEDRHHAYKKLGLSVLVYPNGDLRLEGVLGKAPSFLLNDSTSRNTARRRRTRGRNAPSRRRAGPPDASVVSAAQLCGS